VEVRDAFRLSVGNFLFTMYVAQGKMGGILSNGYGGKELGCGWIFDASMCCIGIKSSVQTLQGRWSIHAALLQQQVPPVVPSATRAQSSLELSVASE